MKKSVLMNSNRWKFLILKNFFWTLFNCVFYGKNPKKVNRIKVLLIYHNKFYLEVWNKGNFLLIYCNQFGYRIPIPKCTKGGLTMYWRLRPGEKIYLN